MAKNNIDDWEDIPLQPDSEIDDWEDVSSQQEPMESDISMAESALQGAGQGVTLGFGDELQAGAFSAIDRLTSLLSGSPSYDEIDEELSKAGFTGDVGEGLYTELRDEQRADLEAAREANPSTFLAGEIAGSASLPLGQIGALGKAGSAAAKGAAKLLPKGGAVSKAFQAGAKLAPTAAAESAAYSAGIADDTENIVEDALTAGLGGAILSTAIPGVATGAVEMPKNLLKGSGKLLAKVGGNVPNKLVDDLAEGKFADVKFKDTGQAVDTVSKGVMDLGKKFRNVSNEAKSKLNNQETIPLNKIIKQMDNVVEDMVGSANAPMKMSLKSTIKDIAEDYGNTLKIENLDKVLTDLGNSVSKSQINSIKREINKLGTDSIRKKDFEQIIRRLSKFEEVVPKTTGIDTGPDKIMRIPVKKIMNNFDKFSKKNLSEVELQNLYNDIKQRANYSKNSQDFQSSDVFNVIGGKVSQNIKNSNPEYKKLMSEAEQLGKRFTKLTKGLGISEDTNKIFDELGNVEEIIKKASVKNKKNLANKIKDAANPEGLDSRDFFLDEENARLLGYDPEEFLRSAEYLRNARFLEDKSLMQEIIDSSSNIVGGSALGLGLLGSITTGNIAPLGGALATSALTGSARKALKNQNLVQKARNISKNVVEAPTSLLEATPISSKSGISKTTSELQRENRAEESKLNLDRLFSAGNSQISELSKAMRDQGKAGQEFSRVLDQAILNEDRRDTLLFGLAQQSAFRQLFKKLQKDEQGK